MTWKEIVTLIFEKARLSKIRSIDGRFVGSGDNIRSVKSPKLFISFAHTKKENKTFNFLTEE